MKSLLSVQTEPEGARVTVRQDGAVVSAGPAPFAYSLDEGEYDVVVEHPDYRSIEQHVRIRPGKVYVVIVEMSQGQFLGYLRATSDPPGASVYIDDRDAGAVGTTPFQNPLPTGTHTVWIERPGYAPEQREVEIGIGDEVELDVNLERVTYGRMRIVANVRGAEVFVDGVQVGEVPYEGDVEAGVHEVRVSAPGMKDWEEDVDIPRGQLVPMRLRLRPAPGRGGAVTTLVMAALITGGSGALHFMRNDLLSEVRRDRDLGILASNDPRINRGRYMTIGMDAGYGLGGLLGLLSIYAFLHDELPDSEGNVLEPRDWALVTPMIQPRTGTYGLQWEGRF